jgi:hypothetical protein
VPELAIDVAPVAHPQDEWAGVLNLPARLTVSGTDAGLTRSAPAGEAHFIGH